MVSTYLQLRKTSSRFVSLFQLFYYILLGIVNFFIPESWKHRDITGQTVLITGGGSGIGQLMAVKFAKLKCKVVIWDVSKEGMEKTVEMFRLNGLDTSKCFCYQINLCDREAIYETAKQVLKDVSQVDVLINNAGVVTGKEFLDQPDEKIKMTFDVNVLAHFYIIKAFLPSMIERNSGHIVTVASVAGNLAGCAMSDYHASKFANVGFDMALRMELAQANLDGIRTSIVKPFFISTGMFAGTRSDLVPFLEPQYVADRIISGILAGTPEIIVPYYLVYVFQLVQILPSRCLVPILDFLGGFEAMNHFQGRDLSIKESNNNVVNGSGKKLV